MPAKMCFSPLALGLAAVALAVSAPARADDEATGLDAVVVVVADRASTATKTDTRLIETPQSISVIGMEQAADRGAQNLQEVLRCSAGAVAEA